jgi:hypothetical protein
MFLPLQGDVLADLGTRQRRNLLHRCCVESCCGDLFAFTFGCLSTVAASMRHELDSGLVRHLNRRVHRLSVHVTRDGREDQPCVPTPVCPAAADVLRKASWGYAVRVAHTPVVRAGARGHSPPIPPDVTHCMHACLAASVWVPPRPLPPMLSPQQFPRREWTSTKTLSLSCFRLSTGRRLFSDFMRCASHPRRWIH